MFLTRSKLTLIIASKIFHSYFYIMNKHNGNKVMSIFHLDTIC